MRTRNFLAIISCLLGIYLSSGQGEEDVSLYSIPTNAQKIGPLNTRDPNLICYNYFLPEKEISSGTLIGRETFWRNVLVKRELFKNQKEHGVQKEWYTNGQEKLEAPYQDGVMNGLFKHWDIKGNLVGKYEMKQGNGSVRIYNSDGRLIKDYTYKDNNRNGLAMEVSGENVWSLNWYKNGKLNGEGLDFYADGQLNLMTWLLDSKVNGPMIKFSHLGALVKSNWYLQGKEVSEDDYIKAARSDSTLPPHHADAVKYKDLENENVPGLKKKYLEMPRVKIPLEFDDKGSPIPVAEAVKRP